MKIAINLKPSDQISGGGITFLKLLVNGLIESDYKVFFNLNEPDLDLILIMDPRWNHSNNSFNSREILRYLTKINPKVIVVHRINECDERKNTNFMNKKLRQINYLADSTVFVGKWLLGLNVKDNLVSHDLDTIIRNGADKNIFNNYNFNQWLGAGPLKLVTHHWSNNRMKGFDIYEQLDNLLGQEDFRKKFAFTYIGNLPKKFKFANSLHINPVQGAELALKIKENHGYITATVNEPGGNHQNEGAACGLPLLYRNSGCLPEYCEGYGVMFDENNFEAKLKEYYDRYSEYVNVMSDYPNTSDVMVNNYLNHFALLIAKRDYIISRRKISRTSKGALRLKFPI